MGTALLSQSNNFSDGFSGICAIASSTVLTRKEFHKTNDGIPSATADASVFEDTLQVTKRSADARMD